MRAETPRRVHPRGQPVAGGRSPRRTRLELPGTAIGVRLAAALLEAGRTEEARNEYERGCQYGRRPWLCLELVELYRDGTFTEPVPDRAATLLRVSCPELAANDEYPECAPPP